MRRRTGINKEKELDMAMGGGEKGGFEENFCVDLFLVGIVLRS